MPVYDDEKTKTGQPAYDDLGLTPEERAAQEASLEHLLAEPSFMGERDYTKSKESTDSPVSSPKDLTEKEGAANKPEDDTSSQYEADRLGSGYTSDGKRRKPKSKPMSLARKRGLSILGIGLGTTIFTAIFSFLAYLPMRIEAMVKSLEQQYMAQAFDGIQRVSMNIFSDYIVYVIMPNLNGTCHNTVDPSCTFVAKGTGPIDRFYQSWSKVKIEKELADKYGIIIGREGGDTNSKKFYMNLDGRSLDISELQHGRVSLWDLPGNRELSRSEIRRHVMGSLDRSFHPTAVYKRFVVSRYLKNQFGIRFCDQHCRWYEGTHNRVDDAKASLADRKLAFKVFALQSVAPEKYQIIMGCFLDIGSCTDTLDPATSVDTTRMSPAQRQLNSIVARASIGSIADNDLTKLAAAAREAGDIGIKEYMVKSSVKTLAAKMLGEETAEQLARQSVAVMEKSIPIIGWVIFAAKVVHVIDKAPDAWRYTTYALQASTALAVATRFQVAASEMEAGQVTAASLGSYDQALTANALDSGKFASDMTDTPLFAAISGISPSGPTAGLLGTKAFAATPSRYLCDDTKPVNTSVSLTCSDEKLAQDNTYLVGAKSALETMYPGLGTVAGIIDKVVSAVTSLIPAEYLGKALDAVCSMPGPVQTATGMSIPCGIARAASKAASKLYALVVDLMPFILRGDGGRAYDVAAAGYDVMGNRAVRDTLGGVSASPEKVTMVRDEWIARQKAEFQARPLLERLFATDTSYSLVNRVALTAPNRDTNSILVALLRETTQPVNQIDTSIARLGQKQVFASDPRIAKAFGVTQYVAPEAPLHPGEYFNANCAQRYNAETGVLDSSDFLNNHTTIDTVTGEQLSTEPNTCALVVAGFTAMGALSGGFTLPPDTTATGSSNTISDPGDLFGDSTGISCYDDPSTPEKETTDLGEQDGYHDGAKVRIRTCAVSSITSGAGESNPGDAYYINGAEGHAIVNSRLSEHFYKLGKDAAAAIGRTPSVGSAFRSMGKQTNLCQANYLCRNGTYTYVARPGYSNHQMGLALDFSGISQVADTSTCEGRATEPGSTLWSWLEGNARRYGGLQQYTNEAWHWDPLGGVNRCGGGPELGENPL